MSFSQKQKADIISQPIKTSCCKTAFLQGVLAARGHAVDGEIHISIDGLESIEYVTNLIFDIYSKSAEVTSPKSGGRRKLLIFHAKSAEKYLNEINNGKMLHHEKCDLCLSSFLKGVFLASGRVSDPAKQYSLEFSVGVRVAAFSDFFEDIGLVPRVSEKKNESVVYFRNSTHLEDFFALAGMNQTAFDIMNAKIQGELRNTANRIVNCETNNIDRAVSASMSQIALIEELMEKGLLSLLPEELQSTARFRMENKDMSLSQLAGAITPPISKSGLSHRLKKITEMAEAVLKDKKDKF